MKSRMLVAGMAIIALAALSGCAGGVNATKSIEFADSNKTIAEEAKVEASQLESANAKLDLPRPCRPTVTKKKPTHSPNKALLNTSSLLQMPNLTPPRKKTKRSKRN